LKRKKKKKQTPEGFLPLPTFADSELFRRNFRQHLKESADRMEDWLEHELEAPWLEERHFSSSYFYLAYGIESLRRHDDTGLDWPEAGRLRPLCWQLWMTLRDAVGIALDECLEQGVPSDVFWHALHKVQGKPKRFRSDEEDDYRWGWRLDNMVRLDYDEDVADLFEEWQRECLRGNTPSEGGPSRRSASPAKRAISKSLVPGLVPGPPAAMSAPAPRSGRAHSKSPAKGTISPRKPIPSSKANFSSSLQNDRGKIISPTNPATITALNKPNPFHETLPGPEVWHRRMAPYFTFGETPYMQRLVSDQIQEDLDRSKKGL
jgi:hypothetical protein